MTQFSIPITFLLLLVSSILPSVVRSNPSPLQLQSDPDNADVCPDSEPRSSCPVKCFRPDPVCGVDGVIYWCGCADAHCAGARVAKIGFCELGNGASGQAFLLVHIVWLILLGIFVLFGLL